MNKSLPKTVNAVTGQGLRDWLVSKAKLYGTERKLNLTSICMYDTTPSGMRESSENALIAYFAKDLLGVDRLEMYEVDM